MQFPHPLTEGRLVRREKRFLVHVDLLDGTRVIAHTNNTGTMLSCNTPGSRCWLSPADNPRRKLAWTYEIVESDGCLVGINTAVANTLAAEGIENGVIEPLQGYASLRREVRYGESSRIDLLLENPGRRRCWVEVKNVTLSDGRGTALFPDAVTARGLKHLRELQTMVREGDRAVMLFVVQRGDVDRFEPADEIDVAYARELREAAAGGVEVLCCQADVTVDGIEPARALPVTG